MGMIETTHYISGELSEAFTRLDPALSALYEDVKNAASTLENTPKNSSDYADIQYAYDSAKTSYQTRMLEVRATRFKMASDTEKEDALNKRQMHELSMQDTMNAQFAALRKKRLQEKRRKEESGGGWFFYFVLGMWLAQMNNQMNMNMQKHRDVRNDFKKTQTMV